MKTEICSNCGEAAATRRMSYRFDDMGVPILLQNIEVIECPHCGTTDPIIPNMDGLMKVLASAILRNPCKLNGREIRYLRKYVNKSAREFARYLNVDHTHLSKLENDRYEINPRLDRLVRLIVGAMDSELAAESSQLVEMMPNIEDCCPDAKQRIEIDPTNLTYQYA